MYCQKCGVKTKKNAKYCENCGAAQTGTSEKTTVAQDKKTSTYVPPETKKSPNAAILYLVLILLLLFIGASFIFPGLRTSTIAVLPFAVILGVVILGQHMLKKRKENIEKKIPLVAWSINLLLLGAGFMYLGQVKRGFKYLIIALLLCWTVIIPIIMLIMAMIKSYDLAKLINSGKVEIVAGKIVYIN